MRGFLVFGIALKRDRQSMAVLCGWVCSRVPICVSGMCCGRGWGMGALADLQVKSRLTCGDSLRHSRSQFGSGRPRFAPRAQSCASLS